MPTALRGHVNPTRRSQTCPRQSRGHGTLRRSGAGYAELFVFRSLDLHLQNAVEHNSSAHRRTLWEERYAEA